jgi:hypothetical protein
LLGKALDLKSASCKDLQDEINRRRNEHKSKIEAKYKGLEKDIKEQFDAFRKLGLKLPEGFTINDLSKRPTVLEYDEHISRFRVVYPAGYNPGEPLEYTFQMDLTPKSFLDYWESVALKKLEKMKQEEIIKLY